MKATLFIFLFLTFATFALQAHADDKIKMYFEGEEITKIVAIYSKASGQKFIVDPSVRGKISMFLQDPVPLDEAFNQLSSALALNGFGISKQGDTMIIQSARNLQRNLIEVSTEKPSIKPERMYTWVYTVKHMQADHVNRDWRILMSKDGEITVNTDTNQLIFCDWTSNLNRVASIMQEIDKDLDPTAAKFVEASKKEREAKRKEKPSGKEKN